MVAFRRLTAMVPTHAHKDDDAADEGNPNEPVDIPRGQGERVLVVDDEAALADLMERNLSEMGYRCESFISAIGALQAFRFAPDHYAAVITDERMPGMSGTALIREVHGIRADIPALLVSGHVDAELRARARDAGAAQVLQKPVARQVIAAALARLLERG